MADASLRGQLLRLLLFPVAGILAVSSVAAYYLAREPANDVYDGQLIDAGISLCDRIQVLYSVPAVVDPSPAGEIRKLSPRDLRPIEPALAPAETHPLIEALNQLLVQVGESNRNQQRFLANAAHQLRTPLAGLRTHAELALAQPLSEETRAEIEQVHSATVRIARLANQLLALARAEPGGRVDPHSAVDLKGLAEGAADEWVHSAL